MAAGDQTWDPSLEDKMVRWTSGGTEREIDKAARRLGMERQFKKTKKREAAAPVEPGVRVHKGAAVRIDTSSGGDARAPAGSRGLPGVGRNRRDEDDGGPMLVLPEDAVASSERRRLENDGVPTLEWHADARESAPSEPNAEAEPPRPPELEDPEAESRRPKPGRIAMAGSRSRPPKRARVDKKAGRRAPNLLSFGGDPD